MFIVDAHLDLSHNAFKGRDVLQPARLQPMDGREIATVGLPDLREGFVDLICATVFCSPAYEDHEGYKTAAEAREMGKWHLDWYREQIAKGVMRFVTTASEIKQLKSGPRQKSQAAILLLEGADPLTSEADVADWFAAGLRIVGLAWKQTRMAGGTGAPGPLTAEGIQLVKWLDAVEMIHDTSHLAEESFWQLMDLSGGPMMASHSNCRSIVPTDRQLSDEMILALVKRKGVIGINFYDKFLLPPAQYGKRRAKLADLVDHMKHICDLAGSAKHVAIGTDMDGGLGRNEIPEEIVTSADLGKVGEALADGGFDDADVAGILADNWLGFFGRSLAGGTRSPAGRG